jgi:hypothetical protein
MLILRRNFQHLRGARQRKSAITRLIRKLLLYLESRPQEFHPQPLAERCVNLSIHTAPIKQTHPPSPISSVRRALGISDRPLP